MAKQKASPGGKSAFPSEPELIVVTKPQAAVRARGLTVASATGADVSGLAKILKDLKATLHPLFGPTEERIMARATAFGPMAAPSDLAAIYRVEAAPDRLAQIAKRLQQEETVEAAFIKPPAEPAVCVRDMLPPQAEAPPTTPDFAPRQLYLDAAPGGIDARYAWTLAGGSGTGVRIIDVEGAWRFDHEDLLQNQGGVVGGTPSTDIGWRNHGTAVTGEFGGDRNSVGIVGICPDANTRAISIFGAGQGSAAAIQQAADRLGAGDIILIELHRPGPRFNFQSRADQLGFIAVEWWPDDFAAIRYAISRGVVVIEAGGNGAENLDDPIYSNRPANFPSTWRNPFARGVADSGAILVGAGAPPPGTHGRDHGPDRSRLDFSNYGSAVDVQGWGREVTTTGYGDLQGGPDERVWYTDVFSGTSSASPIVVGAAGCVQGALRGCGRTPLTPAQMRDLFRTTGSPQQDAPGRPATQRIGNRPNLRQAITRLIPTKSVLKDSIDTKHRVKEHVKEGKELAKEHIKEVKEFKEKEKEVKEFKEKEKEAKEFKEKEGKEFKEKDKDIFEHGGGFGGPTQASPTASPLEARLAQLEQQVGTLAHFIEAGLRPDLGASALSSEEDVRLLRAQLEKQSADAKAAKEMEKPSEV